MLSIRLCTDTDLDTAAAVVAGAMKTNPVNVAAFGPATEASAVKQTRMFRYVLSKPENTVYLAIEEGTIVGVMCYTSSKHCQMKPGAMLRMLPQMFRMFGKDLLRGDPLADEVGRS